MEPVLFAALGGAFTLVAGYVVDRKFSFLAQRPEDYANDATPFDLRTHLNGAMLCEGVIYGPTGRVSSRFTADFDISWTGNEGVMREYFRYDSGERQERGWHLTLLEDGRIEARAEDVVGIGEGRQSGGAVLLRYALRLPEDNGGHVLDVTDWMYMTPSGTIVNRSQFRKFGVKVAELVATMRPAETETVRSAA